MSEARIAGTADYWDATLIAHLKDVEAAAWECCGCTAEFEPVAWRPGKAYLRTAYFRIKRGRTHADECLYDDQPASSGRRTSRSRTAAGRSRPPVGVVDVGQAVGRPIALSAGEGPGDADRRRRPMMVAVSTTRRSIAAAAFLHAAGTDGLTPLDVRGIPTLRHRNYRHVFSRVGRTAPPVEEARIWFGELRSAQEVVVGDGRRSE